MVAWDIIFYWNEAESNYDASENTEKEKKSYHLWFEHLNLISC